MIEKVDLLLRGAKIEITYLYIQIDIDMYYLYERTNYSSCIVDDFLSVRFVSSSHRIIYYIIILYLFVLYLYIVAIPARMYIGNE